MQNIIFEISGGMGKSIMSTAVIRSIKAQYPDSNIIVISEYPAVFLNNPNVYRVYRNNSAYFYDEHIKDKEVKFVCMEPYRSHGFLTESEHLTKSWCEINNIKWTGPLPELYMTPLEIQRIQNAVDTSKPILVFQPYGGFNRDLKYSWNRDIPPNQAQEVVRRLSDTYNVFQLSRTDQLPINGATIFSSDNIRDLFALIAISSKRIGIDSFMQHCAAAFKLPSTVCWITNSPTVFGYESHSNIKPAVESNQNISHIDGVYSKYDFTGTRAYDFPYNTTDIFNIDKIVSNI
jgi:ADP-heptose:LPS heptosyltransferase